MLKTNTNNLNNGFRGIKFDNTYTSLPKHFYKNISPTPVINPSLVILNKELSQELGLDEKKLESKEGVSVLAGNTLPVGANSIATAYAGHQFGHFVPQLGDGRAHLLGEIIDSNGARRDIQLKGSGQTYYSRGSDGRAPLGAVIREYIISEAMHALGIATTRSLAVIKTGEEVFRETPLPGGILTRIAASHIRIGSFEYFSHQQDNAGLKQLVNYAIARHYPNILNSDNPCRYLLEAVLKKQAALVAKWMHVGFIHGVMNTDNTSISGETIDYGPCAFMDDYNYSTVFSSIDRHGRYAYGNQAKIMEWNLTCLAQALLPLLDKDVNKATQIAQEVLHSFDGVFNNFWLTGMRLKLGLTTEAEEDMQLINDLLELMQLHSADFTLTFHYLSESVPAEKKNNISLLFDSSATFDAWLTRWRNRLKKESLNNNQPISIMKKHNPVVIPRNHLVEQAITAAVTQNNYTEMEKLILALKNPYQQQPKFSAYIKPPPATDRVYQTFCGT